MWEAIEGVVQRCPGMSAGSLVVPLLERCGIESALQLARFAHSRLPPLRLGLSVPSLHFHLSPGRLHRVMRVLDGALPSARLSSRSFAMFLQFALDITPP
jgi:hypothetical protein